jgi:integrase
VATFTQLASGNWRVQVRRKTRYVAETFRRRKDGEEWALEMERNIDRNGSSKPRVVRNVRTFGDLIDLHDEDMREVGKPPRRSKAAVMASLKTELGSVKLPAINRERLIEFGGKRAKQGAGPATLSIDLSFIRTIITHAAAVHGIEVSAEEARLARVALSHLNLVGRSKERDRRPTQDELDELIEYFETNPRQFIPMGRIVRYAVATTLRQEEICKPEWPLVDMKKRLVVIQDRKDPRNKEGNDQKVPSYAEDLLKEELHVVRNDIRHHPTAPNESRVTPQRRTGVHRAGRRTAGRTSVATESNFDTCASSW